MAQIIGYAGGAFLNVSTDGVSVPSLIGETRAGAIATLQSDGLEATTTYAFSPNDAGVVIAQSPAAGAIAQPGDNVAMVVSRGRATVKIRISIA